MFDYDLDCPPWRELPARVMETDSERACACVAVYSDADRAAKHVAMADLAVHIGWLDPCRKFICGRRFDHSARRWIMGAQAIPSGYGFLSENPDFGRLRLWRGAVFNRAFRRCDPREWVSRMQPSADGGGGCALLCPAITAETSPTILLAVEAGKDRFTGIESRPWRGGRQGDASGRGGGRFRRGLASAALEAKNGLCTRTCWSRNFTVTHPRHIEFRFLAMAKRAASVRAGLSASSGVTRLIEEATGAGAMTEEMRRRHGAGGVKAPGDRFIRVPANG